MFLGIGEEGWEQLFSGSVGALIAAVIGATVAVGVLILTNQHQRKLSNQQLAEQRAESSRVRRNEAIARIIFTATQFRQTADDQVRHALVADMESAVLVWEFEESNKALFSELRLWPQLLFVESARMFKSDGQSVVIHNQILRVSGLTFSLTSNLKRWPGADANGRAEIVGNLVEARGEISVMFLNPPVGTHAEGGSGA